MRTEQEITSWNGFKKQLKQEMHKCLVEFVNNFDKNVVSKLVDMIEEKQTQMSKIKERLSQLELETSITKENSTLVKQQQISPQKIQLLQQRGNILSQQISKYSIKNVEVNNYEKQMNQTPQNQLVLQNEQIGNQKNITNQIISARKQDQSGLELILITQSISMISGPQNEQTIEKSKHFKKMVQSWPKKYSFISTVISESTLQIKYKIQFNGLLQSKSIFLSTVQELFKIYQDFLNQYKKNEDDFKPLLIVQELVISNSIPLEMFQKIINIKWNRLQKIIYQYSCCFNNGVDLIFMTEILQSNIIKQTNVFFFRTNYLIPKLIKKLIDSNITCSIYISVQLLSVQNHQFLRKITTNKKVLIIFRLPSKEYTSEEEVQFVHIELATLRSRSNESLFYFKRLYSLDFESFNKKTALMDKELQEGIHKQFGFPLSNKSKDAVNSLIPKKFYYYQNGFSIQTFPKMNLTKLFTEFTWQQLNKINFIYLHNSDQWKVFIDQSEHFPNLKIINLQNPHFDTSKLNVQFLRKFKRLKYLIIDGRAIGMKAKLTNKSNFKYKQDDQFVFESQNSQKTIESFKRFEQFCQEIPSLHIVIKRIQQDIQSEQSMKRAAIKSRYFEQDPIESDEVLLSQRKGVIIQNVENMQVIIITPVNS